MEVVDRKDCTIERELRDEVGGSGYWVSASAVRTSGLSLVIQARLVQLQLQDLTSIAPLKGRESTVIFMPTTFNCVAIAARTCMISNLVRSC